VEAEHGDIALIFRSGNYPEPDYDPHDFEDGRDPLKIKFTVLQEK